MKPLAEYKTLIFDCDGVILDSNSVKSEAFHSIAMSYSKQAADQFVAYHMANGGISRWRKFEYFLEHIIGEAPSQSKIEAMVKNFSDLVVEKLLTCPITPGLAHLRRLTSQSSWMIASGGAQDELRYVFEQRQLADLFDAGIFGSPDNKKTILQREVGDTDNTKPLLFLGDSRYDFEAAQSIQADFIFISGWTDLSKWSSFINQHGLLSADKVQDITQILMQKHSTDIQVF